MTEKLQSIVEIKDLEHEVFEELLWSIYSRKLNKIEKFAKGLSTAAEKYNIQGLKTLGENFLSENLTADNALEYFNLADLHEANILKNKSINFFVG